MQELEKIIEKMKEIKDGNRKEKLYAKYPPNSKNQEVLNAYSQGYEDGTDNFYNAIVDDIRKYVNDGWISVEERLPEDGKSVLCCSDDERMMIGVLHKEYYVDFGIAVAENYNQIMNDVIAWRPLPEPYRPEVGGVEKPNETQANRA